MPWPLLIAYHLAITLILVRLLSNLNVTVPPLRNDIAAKPDPAILLRTDVVWVFLR